MGRRWLIGAAVLLGAVYLNNASWLAPTPEGTPRLLAHRGIHQNFRRAGLTNATCTAARMLPPTNPYLENTLASMTASFAAGASVLELDVHPTSDGDFAVFHDGTLDCRSNGHGATRAQTMAYLKTLDIGFGYTADGGKTYPFRGKGIGLMPSLEEVFAAFPGRQFLIHINSNDPSDAERLVAYLTAHHRPTDSRLWVYAAEKPGDRLHQLAPEARVMSHQQVKRCVYRYLATGWTGYVPQSCRGDFIAVRSDHAWAYWGWPNRFLKRMKAAGVIVVITPAGEVLNQEPYSADLDAIPDGFDGLITTDYIETFGPEARRRWPN
jgi:glycerophosphoryl diester phosphodiesterase